jgi:hypothetical protein
MWYSDPKQQLKMQTQFRINVRMAMISIVGIVLDVTVF